MSQLLDLAQTLGLAFQTQGQLSILLHRGNAVLETTDQFPGLEDFLTSLAQDAETLYYPAFEPWAEYYGLGESERLSFLSQHIRALRLREAIGREALSQLTNLVWEEACALGEAQP